MPDAEQPDAQPDLPAPYQSPGGGKGKRRGRARRSHTVAKVLLATVLTLAMVSGLSVGRVTVVPSGARLRHAIVNFAGQGGYAPGFLR